MKKKIIITLRKNRFMGEKTNIQNHGKVLSGVASISRPTEMNVAML
jgi:hypothetical protein